MPGSSSAVASSAPRQPVGGLRPVVRDRREAAGRRDPAGRSAGMAAPTTATTAVTSTAMVLTRRSAGSVRSVPRCAPRRAADEQPVHGPRETEHQREPDDRVELVHVAQRRQHAVERGLQLRRRTSPATAPMCPIVTISMPDEQAEHAGTAGAGLRRCRRPTSPSTSTTPLLRIRIGSRSRSLPARDVASTYGDPVRGAAQRVEQRRRERGDRRRLDEVEERRAVAPEHEQRDQPPQRGRRSVNSGHHSISAVRRAAAASGSAARPRRAGAPRTSRPR